VFDLRLQYWDALGLCAEQHIPMTELLVEKLSPVAATDGLTDAERCHILEAVGEVCYSQDQYLLAAKKFTQAGKKVKVGWLSFDTFVQSKHCP